MSTITTDPIADMLARIRNAIAVNKTEITLPHSKAKESIAKILKQNHYIAGISVSELTVGKSMTLQLRNEDSNAQITEISRMSRPGRRMYVSTDKIPRIKQGRGIVIISTSRGIITGGEAKSQRLGGELICKVY
ncbi:30S ribosomal protein S8 [Candidatus Saccharibacteria bacterium]|nr:30S ribosomal protein S8 [Candidatus Saccharibacteria bacterium]